MSDSPPLRELAENGAKAKTDIVAAGRLTNKGENARVHNVETKANTFSFGVRRIRYLHGTGVSDRPTDSEPKH